MAHVALRIADITPTWVHTVCNICVKDVRLVGCRRVCKFRRTSLWATTMMLRTRKYLLCNVSHPRLHLPIGSFVCPRLPRCPTGWLLMLWPLFFVAAVRGPPNLKFRSFKKSCRVGQQGVRRAFLGTTLPPTSSAPRASSPASAPRASSPADEEAPPAWDETANANSNKVPCSVRECPYVPHT